MKKNIHIISLLLIFSGIFLPQSILAQSTTEAHMLLQQAITGRMQEIERYKDQRAEIGLKIRHAELEVRRLLSVHTPEAEFDAKNEAIGIKYEIKAWELELKNIDSSLAALEHANANDQRQLQSISFSGNPTEIGDDTLAEIRKQQLLIQESYRLDSAGAALNLAKARALEPIHEKPVLGETSVLLVEIGSGLPRKFIGVMQHIGGNQYLMEASLYPGKQDFVIGGYRFSKDIPEEYRDSPCLILLDVQDRQHPVLQFFIK